MSKHPKRKNKGPRHANLPREFLRSPAVATLPGAIFKVLVALAAEYHGRNNGALALPRELAREYGITSSDALTRALSGGERHGELVARGLVVITDPGSYAPARTARYALTNRPLDDTEFSRSERLARHTYRTWQPTAELLEQRAERKRRAAKAARRKTKSGVDCRSQPGPTTGPSASDKATKSRETGPTVGPDDAVNGTYGRAPLRSNHSTGTGGSQA